MQAARLPLDSTVKTQLGRVDVFYSCLSAEREVMVKAANEGSGIGIPRVKSAAQFCRSASRQKLNNL